MSANRTIGILFAVVLVTAHATFTVADDNWPQFRGSGAGGIGSGAPPTEWDVETGQNVEWNTAIPGLGHSSPVVWGNRVFLTTAVNSGVDAPAVTTGWVGGAGESASDIGEWTWQVLCLDLSHGKIIWSRNAHRGEPVIQRHLKASHANCTPATDGQHVVAFFGSEGLVCYDFDGRLIWKRDFGRLHSGPYDAPGLQWGFSSSPVIHDGRVIVQCDCLNINFVAVLDVHTGDEILRIDRSGEVATWATPTVVKSDHRLQIVCNGFRQMAGYSLTTGERFWHLRQGGDVPVPTPLFSDGKIFLTNGHARSHTYAISPEATGDLTPTATDLPDASDADLVWWESKDGSYMPTPLISGGLLYTCNDNGRLTVRRTVDGQLVYRQRVGTGNRTFSASAVSANSHVYFASERGEVSVVAEGETFRLTARNNMNGIVMATPAISGDRLLIRTARRLYCLLEK